MSPFFPVNAKIVQHQYDTEKNVSSLVRPKSALSYPCHATPVEGNGGGLLKGRMVDLGSWIGVGGGL